MRLTQQQGKRLCELVHLLRRDWDLPGIETAVREAAKDATAVDVCVAAIRAAGNSEAKTPGLIPRPGAHWSQTPKGEQRQHSTCAHGNRQRVCDECNAGLTTAPPDWRNRTEPEPTTTDENDEDEQP
ncbi:hypothetical protein [Luteipulveratus halotolerans]|uniref:Uncharacterized protein n=1 Tax=Luteipulveratus halotolerans TaxID=1631356 RepID=A0A0L6CKD2_9MICO|nr:hypothetical protein [Luteipulveratus halotolerans]KNX38075.1 hypothetical protein VV01_14480 [Luteipulveratus halotolerans]